MESPQFGERWARHWMDLVRYAETKGHEFDYVVQGAWQYRDYLIRAFNDDLPYPQLVQSTWLAICWNLLAGMPKPAAMNPDWAPPSLP